MKITTVVRFGCCALMGLALSANNIHWTDVSFWAIGVIFAVYGVACYFDGKAGR